MNVLAIDPGPERSAWVLYDTETKRILDHGKDTNASTLNALYAEIDVGWKCQPGGPRVHIDKVAIEMIASYGMAVGSEVFETCVWIGRFSGAWCGPGAGRCLHGEAVRVLRREVKIHLCSSARAKDANIRAALIDRFGPGKEKAIGTKKAPGPLYGVKADVWAAIAVAITFAERRPVG